MATGAVSRGRRAAGRAVVPALVVAVLVTPAHAAAFPLRDPGDLGIATSCPPQAQRGDDFPAPTRRGVRTLIEDFVAAYNAGDLTALDGLFADEEDFNWYFVSGEREREAWSRNTLLSYFAQRHLLEDRLRVVELNLRPEIGWHGGYDFSVRLKRYSSEERARGWWHGKGAADCAITTWSVGSE